MDDANDLTFRQAAEADVEGARARQWLTNPAARALALKVLLPRLHLPRLVHLVAPRSVNSGCARYFYASLLGILYSCCRSAADVLAFLNACRICRSIAKACGRTKASGKR